MQILFSVTILASVHKINTTIVDFVVSTMAGHLCIIMNYCDGLFRHKHSTEVLATIIRKGKKLEKFIHFAFNFYNVFETSLYACKITSKTLTYKIRVQRLSP